MKITTTKAGKLRIASIVLYGLSFLLPFLDSQSGAAFFWAGAEIFWQGKLKSRHWLPFASIYVPLLSFPVFVGYWKKQPSRVALGAAISILLAPQLVIAYHLLMSLSNRSILGIELIGYAVWFLALLLITLAYSYKKTPQDPTEDYIQHLIEEDHS